MGAKRKRSVAAAGIGGTAALVAAAAGGASWYYARRIVEPAADVPPDPPAPEDHVRIEQRTDDSVWLSGRGAQRPGTWGLAWSNGYAQVSDVEAVDGEGVRRGLRVFEGEPTSGVEAVLDADAYPHDGAALGRPWKQVTYHSPIGDLPAWEYPAVGRTWGVFVHGRTGRRHEAFRAIPTFLDLDMPCLTISYRNDADAPRSPDDRCHLGATEWEDVEGAVIYALSQGADDVVLVGYSMGGSCIAAFMAASTHAARVRGLVLEAPVLDWVPVLRQAARRRGLPDAVLPVLLPATMALARYGSGIDWRAMKHIDRAGDLVHPTLLIHGDADETVPVELADRLAAARPDLITYLRVPGAGHVRSWNVDRLAYESALREHLAERLAATKLPRHRQRKRLFPR
ncbi:MAG: alpha/beta hydrolase [Actinobacteria bacterium]|nr:alpha/beta hydrolase [Actinomycetota bacterium]